MIGGEGLFVKKILRALFTFIVYAYIMKYMIEKMYTLYIHLYICTSTFFFYSHTVFFLCGLGAEAGWWKKRWEKIPSVAAGRVQKRTMTCEGWNKRFISRDLCLFQTLCSRDFGGGGGGVQIIRGCYTFFYHLK